VGTGLGAYLMIPDITDTVDFHDNHIRGISFDDEDSSCDLILDIDYIQEWMCQGVSCEFLIAPAYLRFKQVNNLQILLRKDNFTLNSHLAIILSVESFPAEGNRKSYKISLVDDDLIQFEAEGVELSITGQSTRSGKQYLLRNE